VGELQRALFRGLGEVLAVPLARLQHPVEAVSGARRDEDEEESHHGEQQREEERAHDVGIIPVALEVRASWDTEAPLGFAVFDKGPSGVRRAVKNEV
jgi:hypothetical protein